MAKPKNREYKAEARSPEEPEEGGQSVASMASDVLRDGRAGAEGQPIEGTEDRSQSVASMASDVLRDGRTDADASAAASATLSETGQEVGWLSSLTANLLRGAFLPRGDGFDSGDTTWREQPTPVATAHVSAPAQPVDSGIMVLTRVRRKLQELVQEGVLRSDVHITEVTVSGQRFLEVKAFMPYALFRDTEQRHGLYDSLERLGDSSIHVDAHIYRYRAD